MKKILVSLAILGVSSVWAEESINAQIEALEHAAPQERVSKMNRLKQQIANMNEEERLKVLEQLQVRQSGSAQKLQLQHKQGSNTCGVNFTQQHRLMQTNALTPKMQGR